MKRKPTIPKTQICSCCERRRSASLFYADPSRPSGLKGWCKECWSAGGLRARRRKQRQESTRKSGKKRASG